MNRLLPAVALLLGLVLTASAALEKQLELAGSNAGEIRRFLEAAEEKHGAAGQRAAAFLVEHMPAGDLQALESAFLLENLDLAFQARATFPWAKNLPEAVFLNEVLPYASLDETRESWRPGFLEKCAPLVADCQTAAEAAQVLNREFFNLIGVHYNTGRKAPNQSPSESVALGKATCTGLSIILVNACRSVGVPARIAGTPLWSDKRGNHTWVEIRDGDEWFFTGADEYNKNGLNRAWFTKDAAKAIADDWKHAIWATSWKRTGSHFPMVWDLENRTVPAVNVTARYVPSNDKPEPAGSIYVRLWEKKDGGRLVARVELLDAGGAVLQTITTKGDEADLNDMPELTVPPAGTHRLRITRDGEQRTADLQAGENKTLDLIWPELRPWLEVPAVQSWLSLPPDKRATAIPDEPLSKAEAGEAARLILQTLCKEASDTYGEELEQRVIHAAGKEMKWLEQRFGKAAPGERSLWISMHGGGGAPAAVNDQQWRNQIRLYAPEEGFVVAPRAPTDTWNLWHEGHIDTLFQRLIDLFVCERGVSPDRIYLLGYSAGGDGVYQLAPRMADRFAAAAMMAGHPNDAQPTGLRNLPFMIFMGARDAAYDRNKVAARWGDMLAALRKDDPDGYLHQVTIYPELGHWMNGQDRVALPWMARHTRDPWPKKVVWRQSARTHDRFYWLAMPADHAKKGQTVTAEVKGQVITIETKDVTRLQLRLSDELVDLDQPIRVTVNGAELFQGAVPRAVGPIWQSLRERKDPRSAATVTLDLQW